MKELLNGMNMDYKKSINYHQMWRAGELMWDWYKDWYFGGQRKNLNHMIPSLLSKLKKNDPNFVVDWSNHEDSKVFKKAFIYPSTTKDALWFSQVVVSLDAYQTKTHKYLCQLFVAIVLDGFMCGVIVYYVIAPVENEDNWTWFLKLSKESIHKVQDVVIPLILD